MGPPHRRPSRQLRPILAPTIVITTEEHLVNAQAVAALSRDPCVFRCALPVLFGWSVTIARFVGEFAAQSLPDRSTAWGSASVRGWPPMPDGSPTMRPVMGSKSDRLTLPTWSAANLSSPGATIPEFAISNRWSSIPSCGPMEPFLTSQATTLQLDSFLRPQGSFRLYPSVPRKPTRSLPASCSSGGRHRLPFRVPRSSLSLVDRGPHAASTPRLRRAYAAVPRRRQCPCGRQGVGVALRREDRYGKKVFPITTYTDDQAELRKRITSIRGSMAIGWCCSIMWKASSVMPFWTPL